MHWVKDKELATQLHFHSSPTIRVNQIDIGFEQQANDCDDCLTNSDGCTCRTWQFLGQEYEVPPVPMLVDRIIQVVYGNSVKIDGPFKLPNNLERFHANQKDEKNECCAAEYCS